MSRKIARKTMLRWAMRPQSHGRSKLKVSLDGSRLRMGCRRRRPERPLHPPPQQPAFWRWISDQKNES